MPGPGDMALETGQMGGVEDEGPAAGVATGGHVREEPIPRLGKERFGQALGLRTSREEVHRAGEADHHRRNVQNSRSGTAHGISLQGNIQPVQFSPQGMRIRGSPREGLGVLG